MVADGAGWGGKKLRGGGGGRSVAGCGLANRLRDLAGAEEAALDEGDAEDHDQAADDQAEGEGLVQDHHAEGDGDQGDEVGDQGGDGGAALLEGAVVEQVGVAGAEGAEQDQAEGGLGAEGTRPAARSTAATGARRTVPASSWPKESWRADRPVVKRLA